MRCLYVVLFFLFLSSFLPSQGCAFPTQHNQQRFAIQKASSFAYTFEKTRQGNGEFRLGSLSQSAILPEEFGAVRVLLYGGLIVYSIISLGFAIGNIHSAITKKKQRDWGIASIAWSGLNTGILLGSLMYMAQDGTNFSGLFVAAGVLTFHLANLALGIFNIREHIKRKTKVTSIIPWLDYSRQTQAFSGGLSLSGTF